MAHSFFLWRTLYRGSHLFVIPVPGDGGPFLTKTLGIYMVHIYKYIQNTHALKILFKILKRIALIDLPVKPLSLTLKQFPCFILETPVGAVSTVNLP